MSDRAPPPPPPPSGSVPPPPPQAGGSDDRTMATLAHAGQLLAGFLVPLVIYLVNKDESPFVEDQAKEALNFSITIAIASIVSVVLIFVLIGILLIVVVVVCAIVFPILGAVAANRGEYYRYPLCLRLVS